MTIQLTDVLFAYPETAQQTVLDIKSMSVSAGEQVFIHGPSGGGKSTLLNLLSGMIQADSGQVSVLGKRLDKMTSRQRDRFRADHIGYIFQQFNLIPYLDAIDNIQLAHHFSKRQSASSLTDEIAALLLSFRIDQADWHKPVSKLSIGQQQRIAIVRAMINKPELLIADEPTSSLDQDNRDNFMAELMTVVAEQKTTLLFVSHDMSLASYFDRHAALSSINNRGDLC
ncbi:putative ABC transporter ATP-binding protein [Sinobacterium norvegicum]|uniref:ABC transporter ATP-binding protein n=1 Tax=Sinobacterium norvegicum TaxID=1641715 RepID=A0ABN8EMG7_9GAMM|nr:ABC transporter ATP-binding protein [Sinobacterium norvegicum]CAH0992370.1 putative ABC transporter ATP-binding protein [Sinobacterium norvegicum]